jgi:hypothetical protein
MKNNLTIYAYFAACIFILAYSIFVVFKAYDKEPVYEYEINGYIEYENKLINVSAYSDTTFYYNEDSVWFYNSDGSILRLLPPYHINKIK